MCVIGGRRGHEEKEEEGGEEEGGEEEDRTVTELISTGNGDNGNLSKNINFQANLFFLVLRRNGGTKGEREEGGRKEERGKKEEREDGEREKGRREEGRKGGREH